MAELCEVENAVSCKEIADFIMDYLNGELSQTQHAVFEEHLGECPDCVAYLCSYEMTVKLSKAACDQAGERDSNQVPEDLVRAILAARKSSI